MIRKTAAILTLVCLVATWVALPATVNLTNMTIEQSEAWAKKDKKEKKKGTKDKSAKGKKDKSDDDKNCTRDQPCNDNNENRKDGDKESKGKGKSKEKGNKGKK